ncbi:MAG: hypothetical protein Q8914_05220 [Bacteroidota bacterium]|nr:hypothetical protein [Bacteroidota bacterium]
MFRLFVFPTFILGVSGFLMSCSSMKDLGPDDYLNRARELLKEEQYQSAKLYIDSVRILFPKEFSKIKEGISVMREVNFSEQKRTLAYCDSMLKIRQNELPGATQNFIFQKDAEYETIGHYVPKSLLAENNYGRTFLQSKVDEKGRLILTSYYCGAKKLNHTKIRVSSRDGIYAESSDVPRDGAMNYSFSDGGLQYEIVCFNSKTENGIVDFILAHMDNPVTIELNGNKSRTYVLTSQEKQALKASDNLSCILTDINRLLDEIRLSQAKMEYILRRQRGDSTFHLKPAD